MTEKFDDSFQEFTPPGFHLRPRDTAYSQVAAVFEHVDKTIRGYQPDLDAFNADEVLFDEEVWGWGTDESIPRNEIILESADESLVCIRGLIKAKRSNSTDDHDLLLVTFLAPESDILPWSGVEGWDNLPDEEKYGLGEIVFGREMAPVLVAYDASHYMKGYLGGDIITEKWATMSKVELTDTDVERVVTKLKEMQDDVHDYDPSTFPENQ